jgi:hypothetical protein
MTDIVLRIGALTTAKSQNSGITSNPFFPLPWKKIQTPIATMVDATV